MPTWNKEKNTYEEEEITTKREDYAVLLLGVDDLPISRAQLEREQREERFRTALLNELDWLSRAVREIEIGPDRRD